MTSIIHDFPDIAARVNRAKKPEPVAACKPYDDEAHFRFMLGEQWTTELNEYFTSLAIGATRCLP